MNIFEQFDKEFDVEGLQSEIEEAKENGSNFEYKEVPVGNYEVKIEKMELTKSKMGKPMFTCWFKIVNDCEFKNSMIFMNQVVTQGFQIHIVNEILRSLVEKDTMDIEFKSYGAYAELILEVFEKTGNFEYELKYTRNKKDFPKFEIVDTYILED